MRIKKVYPGCLLFFCGLMLFSQETQFNHVQHFNYQMVDENYYYFSCLNPRYANPEERLKHYIMNCARETIKFIKLDLEYTSQAIMLGSFILNNRKVKTIFDDNIIFDFLDFLKPVRIVETKYNDILILKMAKNDLKAVWHKYHKTDFPVIHDLKIDNVIIKNRPAWFFSTPQKKGYIFGVGIYQNSGDVYKNMLYADYMARVQIINTLNVRVKTKQKFYQADHFQLKHFFNHQESKASIGGLLIINRYYDEKSRTAYSLAVLQYPG